MNFFITGLPRSRTAWLANFMTFDGHFCHHEGLDGCHSVSEYKAKLGDDGDSCTGLVLIDLITEFPDVPVVVIERGYERMIEWTKDVYGKDLDLRAAKATWEALKEIPGLHIKFDEIDDRLEDIWNHCVGGGYNVNRGNMLKGLNIQINDPFKYDLNAFSDLFMEQANAM